MSDTVDTITIVIKTRSDAFDEDFGLELSNVLLGLSDKALHTSCAGDMIGKCAMDSNGNKVAVVHGKIKGVPSIT